MIRISDPPQGLSLLPAADAAKIGNGKLLTDFYKVMDIASCVQRPKNIRKNTTLDSEVMPGCIMHINFDRNFAKRALRDAGDGVLWNHAMGTRS